MLVGLQDLPEGAAFDVVRPATALAALALPLLVRLVRHFAA
jgi:hypothetical protein